MLPVAIFGKSFPQQYLAHILGSGLAILTMKLSYLIKKDKALAVWSGILVGFGSIIWFLSSVGSAWYLGQIAAAFFLTAAIVESLSKKRPFLVGVLLGAAYLSRLQTILSLPLFIYLLKDRLKNNKYFALLTGILPFLVFNALYNYLRFGVLWDKGYLLIPGVLDEPWYQRGIFHLTYIPRHLKILFATFPVIKDKPPFILPSWDGLAIWITTPAFIYSLKVPWKKRVVRISWLTILLISLVIFSHGTTGFAQFGYRFAVDFYPILTFLTIKAVAKDKLMWHHWLFLILAVLVNLWGVVWINKFGWVI